MYANVWEGDNGVIFDPRVFGKIVIGEVAEVERKKYE